MKEYLLTVVVPVFNVEQYLDRCLGSLIKQEQPENAWEVLLVDDGSQDRSGEICDEYATQYSNIQVIHKKNGGLSSARNMGIDHAAGRYVFFVDSDDYVEKNTVKILEQALKKFDYPDAVAFDGVEDNGQSSKIMRGMTSCSGQCISGEKYLLEHYKTRSLSVEACLYLYKKEFLDKNKLHFREGILHEDVEFTPRAILLSKTVAEIPDRLYHYIVRENSISTKKNREKNIKDLFNTLKELDRLADRQEAELCRWMKDAILNSYLNMVYDARIYRKEYRSLLDKGFLKGKAATSFNRVRVGLCLVNVRLYCKVNDYYKKFLHGRREKKCV